MELYPSSRHKFAVDLSEHPQKFVKDFWGYFLDPIFCGMERKKLSL